MIYEIRSNLEPPAISKTPASRGKLPLISGYAAVFNSLSEVLGDKNKPFREIVRPGAFLRSLIDVAQSKADILARFDHEGIFGRTSNGTLRLSEDNHGLRYEIAPADTQAGRDLVELVRRGDVRGSSFAFSIVSDNWRRDKVGLLRELRDVRLIDVSPVTTPAYKASSVKLWENGNRAIDAMRLQLAEATL